jgi:apolipoprotein D and lipocalin family protein
MAKKSLTKFLAAATLLAALAIPHPASAQAVSAIPKLDLTKFIASWYEVAGFPVKAQKHCLSNLLVLYALGDKQNSFQLVTSCQIKDANPDYWNASGKLDPTGSGRLTLRRLLIFHTGYWVIATGPSYEWALVGNPNRKSLWILSKTATLAPAVLAQVESTASAAGYNTAKLVQLPQHN